MITVVRGGNVYAPDPRGICDVVVVGERIASVGGSNVDVVRDAGLSVDVLDASGRLVMPGLIDPHEHLLGGSGEKGFASQTPELSVRELLSGGITTVVGCLGVDVTTKTLPGLLAKARAFTEEGLTALLYTGGYPVPPVTLTGSARNDLLLIPEVIGIGETAVSDLRSTQPTALDLARLAAEAYVGGILSGKAGVLHLHMGEGALGLTPVERLLDEFDVSPRTLYPTHVNRNEPLLRQAVALTRRGVTVDVDTVDRDLTRWFELFVAEGGVLDHLTVSSDASIPSPRTLLEQLREVVHRGEVPLETLLPCFTSNTARTLHLSDKGRLAPTASADILVLDEATYDVVHVLSRGRVLVRDGQLTFSERFLQESNRKVHFDGKKA